MSDPSRSLVKVVVQALVTFVTLFFLAVGLVNYFLARQQEEASLQSTVSNVSTQLAKTLAIPIWNIDYSQVGAIVSSSLLEKSITTILVKTEFEELIYGSKPPAGALQNAPDIVATTLPIVFRSRHLGSLTVIATKQLIYENLNQVLIKTIFLITLLMLILILGLYGVLNRLVLQPIHFVKSLAYQASAQSQLDPIPASVQFYGELAQLKDSISAMFSQIVAEKERLSVTLRSIIDGVITTNTHGQIILMNQVAEIYTGWTQTQAQGRLITDVFQALHPQTREPMLELVQRLIQAGLKFDLEQQGLLVVPNLGDKRIAFNGAPIHDAHNQITGIVLVFRDITEEVRWQQELQRMAKLDSLGVLAGGIAHDFNNLLTAVGGNIEMTQLWLKKSETTQVEHHIQEATRALNRSSQLTKQLLTFAKGGSPLRQTTELSTVLNEAVTLALFGSKCLCRFSIPNDLKPVDGDPGQLIQVFQNLLMNAAQAMPAGGTIQITAQNIETRAQIPATMADLPCVRVDVMDEGMGISAEVLPLIFDPFFTTKEQGTGLGLASVYSILRAHQGFISATSELGKGSTFSVFLPVSRQSSIPPPPDSEKIVNHQPWKILIMDDEVMINAILAKMLTSLGHQVTSVSNGSEAIQVWYQHHDFDLAILDLTIPGGMGGKDVIQQLIQDFPNILAIATSGYATDPIMSRFSDYGFAGRLCKPYSLRDVSQLLANLQNPPK